MLLHPLPPFFFSSVLRKRYDSVPVSMMWAWSVSRSSMALHNVAMPEAAAELLFQIIAGRAERGGYHYESAVFRVDRDVSKRAIRPSHRSPSARIVSNGWLRD